jgi:hypothetical protein
MNAPIKKGTVCIATGAIILLSLPAFAVIDAQKVVIALALAFLFVLYGLHKRRIDTALVVAMLFALFSNLINDYTYATTNIFVLGVNAFSFMSWTAGLTALYFLYAQFRFRYKWVVFSLLFLTILLAVEYIGYYMLDIRLAAGNPSFLGLGVIHGTLAMHIFYPLAGPMYLLITDYFPGVLTFTRKMSMHKQVRV